MENQLKKFRILHADDTEVIRDVMRKLLEQQGYTVISARSAEEALSIIKSQGVHSFDLVISDHNMDGLDGGALFTELFLLDFKGKKALYANKPSKEVLDMYKKLGVDLFMYKAISTREMRDQINKLLQ